MREMIRITVALTISCLIAGSVMGGVFLFTAKAKCRTEAMVRQQTVLELLGYGTHQTAPADFALSHIYRYILSNDSGTRIGYLVPVPDGKSVRHDFLILDRDGGFSRRIPVPIPGGLADTDSGRTDAIRNVIGPNDILRYADEIIIATRGSTRIAYILPGKFPGFKTFIHAMVALNTDFGIMGMEITGHEEDPGLGGEIEKDYFKNQFRERSLEKVKELTVTKDPLPDDYRYYLEPRKWHDRRIGEADAARLKAKYRDENIHAISGATISSRCVTEGIQQMVKNFAFRMQALDRIIKEQ